MPESRNDIIVLVVANRRKFFVLEYSAALTTIATVNFDLMVAFYAQLLGQSPEPYQPSVYAGWKLPGLELGLFQPQASQQDQFAAPSRSLSLCLEVADIERSRQFVRTIGRISPVLTASHGRECYLYDPDDNRIILHQRSPWDHQPPIDL